jgi:MFS transporter, ACS family, allantoate permease
MGDIEKIPIDDEKSSPALTPLSTTEVSYDANGDEAQQHAQYGLVLKPEESKALLRKIDLYLLPLLCVVYCLQFLDKTTLTFASLMGIEADAHLGKNQFQWLGTIFYFGYLVWEYPTNVLLQRLPLAKYSGINVIIW